LRDVKGDFYIYNVDTKKYEKLTPEDYEAAKNMFLMSGVYSKLKFNDFEVDKYDEKNPIYTINGVDYKMINDEFKLKKI
jgi:thymidylate synthase